MHAAHGLAPGVDARRKVDAGDLRYDGAEPESCLSRRDECAEHRTGAGVFDVALDFCEEFVVLDACEVVSEVDEEGVALSPAPPDMPGEVLLESPTCKAYAFPFEACSVVMDESTDMALLSPRPIKGRGTGQWSRKYGRTPALASADDAPVALASPLLPAIAKSAEEATALSQNHTRPSEKCLKR